MRFPAVAGRFYPSDPDELRKCIAYCFTHPLGPGMPGPEGSDRKISGIMVPHAGYLASGMNAAHAYRRAKEDGLPEAYVIIGPDHYGTAGGTVICSDNFLTPLGECGTDADICGKLSEYYPDSLQAHRFEHSIEVQIPFIQFIDPDPAVVPVIMGRQTPGEASRLAGILEKACRGRDVMIVASTDLSHYIPKEKAEILDAQVFKAVMSSDPGRLFDTVREKRITMCGYGPVAVAMEMCGAPEMLLHSDSYDSLKADPDSVVGYGSAVFGRK